MTHTTLLIESGWFNFGSPSVNPRSMMSNQNLWFSVKDSFEGHPSENHPNWTTDRDRTSSMPKWSFDFLLLSIVKTLPKIKCFWFKEFYIMHSILLNANCDYRNALYPYMYLQILEFQFFWAWQPIFGKLIHFKKLALKNGLDEFSWNRPVSYTKL